MEKFNFVEALKKRIHELDFDDFTELQKIIFPELLAKQNIFVEAQYGEGKTASFVVPLLNRIADEKIDGFSTLIITPTRGLIFKVKKTIELYAESVGVSSFAFTHDRNVDNLENDIQGKQIIVATAKQLPTLEKYLDFTQIKQIVVDDYNMMMFFNQHEPVLRLLTKLSLDTEICIFTNSKNEAVDESLDGIAKLKSIKIESHDLALDQMKHQRKICDGFEQQAIVLKEVLNSEHKRRILLFVSEPWQMKKVADMLRNKMQMSCRYVDLERYKIDPHDVQLFLEGAYQVLILFSYTEQDLHIHEANQIINIGLPHSAQNYINRVNMLARRSKLYRTDAIVNISELSEFASAKRLSEDLGIEFEEVTGNEGPVDKTIQFGRVHKDRIRRR